MLLTDFSLWAGNGIVIQYMLKKGRLYRLIKFFESKGESVYYDCACLALMSDVDYVIEQGNLAHISTTSTCKRNLV